MKKKIDTPYVYMEYENGMISGAYKKNVDIDLEVAKSVVHIRQQLTLGQKCPMMVDVRKLRSVTREARSYFASEEGSENLSAAAVIVSNSFSATLANFFMNINFSKKRIPLKLFNDEVKAVNWLSQFK